MQVRAFDHRELEDYSVTNTLYETGLSLIHPFYNDWDRFQLQYDLWMSWSDELKKAIHIVLIDDCSSKPLHKRIKPGHYEGLKNHNFSIYRITTPLKWNTPGALNLGFSVAPTQFALCMDSDCGFEADALTKLMSQRPSARCVYKFPRRRISKFTGVKAVKQDHVDKIRYLPCTMLMHTSIFWQSGGFEEDFTGEYSGGYGFFDNDFDKKYTGLGYPWCVWDDISALEWMESVCGPRVERIRDDEVVNKKLMYGKWKGEVPRSNRILRFEWENVYRNLVQ